MSAIKKPSKILGYERADGSFGIRNHVAIVPTVCCVNEVAKKVADPHRPGHEFLYHPGEINFRRADVLVINKIGTADEEKVSLILDHIKKVNPEAKIVHANSPIFVSDEKSIANKKVLVIEDGPTLTHGEMAYGAGVVAANQLGAAEIIDPRPFAVESIKETFDKFTHLNQVLPAMGYGEKQISDLTQTINKADCDLVVSGTPIDLSRLIETDKKILHVCYEIEEIGSPDLEEVLQDIL